MTFELNRGLPPDVSHCPPGRGRSRDGEHHPRRVRDGLLRGSDASGPGASSPIINQSNERNASLVDAHGRLAACSIGTPHLTFVSQLTVRYGLMIFDEFDWGPGDVFLGNDPDYGGGHLPDYNVYAPVFDDAGELVLVQSLQAHQGDTGGKDPGGFTLEATDIFTEGLAIPCLKLVHRGEKRAT